MPNSAGNPPSLTPARPLSLNISPEQAFAAWPITTPLVALWSGGNSPNSRWTILSQPRESRSFTPTTTAEARHALAALLPRASTHSPDPNSPPFQGGTIAALSYDLGRILEPAATKRTHPITPPPTHPLILTHTCTDALIYDHLLNTWWSLGTPPPLSSTTPATFHLGQLQFQTTSAAYQSNVTRILEYIRAGDIYQANLAHHLHATFSGSTRAFFLALAAAARPWYGSYLEFETLTIASASPELFIDFNPHTRTLTTRPMKGTSPAASAASLSASDKDAAELNMITDLMRNDLGAVCDLGSVHVQRQRDLETHGLPGATARLRAVPSDSPPHQPGHLAQTTSTISGTLRQDLTIADALASMLPGGSVTGCPKIRAMQIIEELEPSPRSFYCGSIGYISHTGHAAFNIAIRTATFANNSLTYPVGAGIVIDSNPAAEWQETLDKAGVLQRVIDSQHP